MSILEVPYGITLIWFIAFLWVNFNEIIWLFKKNEGKNHKIKNMNVFCQASKDSLLKIQLTKGIKLPS